MSLTPSLQGILIHLPLGLTMYRGPVIDNEKVGGGGLRNGRVVGHFLAAKIKFYIKENGNGLLVAAKGGCCNKENRSCSLLF